MDILIIKLGALGDVINTLPMAIRLKKGLNARIHWLVAPLSYPLLKRHEAVDHTILFDRNGGLPAIRKLINELREQSFDVVLDLQRMLKSGLICMAAPGERKIGFDRRRCKELTWLLPMERIPASDPTAHMLCQYLEFAEFLGVRIKPVEWRIGTDTEKPKELSSKFVVLNIGATKPANRWTTENYSSLARMIGEKTGLYCTLTGGKEDLPMAEGIARKSGGNAVNLVGKTTLLELVAVLDAAEAVITCDTGPMHLAVALGKKVIALFGPSDPRRTGPYRGTVVRSDLACVPCNRKICATPDCMKAIRPDEVFRALSEAIGEKI